MAYITEAETVTYFAGTVHAATWDAVDVAQKPLLLETASRYIDDAFTFVGVQVGEITSWPRTDAVNLCNSTEYTNTDIPESVKAANAEIALQMSKDESLTSGSLNTTDYNIVEMAVSSLAIKYKDNASASNGAQPYGYTWLRCLLTSTGGMVSARIRKG